MNVLRKTVYLVNALTDSGQLWFLYESTNVQQAIPIPLISHDGGKTWLLDDTDAVKRAEEVGKLLTGWHVHAAEQVDKIRSISSRLVAKDAEIARLTGTIAKMAKSWGGDVMNVDALCQIAAEKDAEIARLRETIGKMHMGLSGVRNDATTGTNWKAMIDNIIEDRKEEDAKLAETRKALSLLNATNTAKDAEIARLTAELAGERMNTDILAQRAKEQDAEIGIHKTALSDFTRTIKRIWAILGAPVGKEIGECVAELRTERDAALARVTKLEAVVRNADSLLKLVDAHCSWASPNLVGVKQELRKSVAAILDTLT